MKKTFTFIISACFVLGNFLSHAQVNSSGNPHTNRCATELEFDEHVKQDPSLLEQRELFEQRVADFIKNNPAGQSIGSSVPRIIPVVVHVYHQGGIENISDAQILDQIRVLNEDFRRLHADTNNTPVPFRAFAADCNIEFKMAQKDPNGNCTDGIIRVQTPLTNFAMPRDTLKYVSHWPSTMYLNMWVVTGIYDQNGLGGTILGYAQFPQELASRPLTDGVVVLHNYFGTIGTAQGSGYAGRVSTHEVGHWLGLRHIWGDDNGSCVGTDLVGDTPNQADKASGCPTFPQLDGCTGTGNGVMYMNYMDYSDGNCQNIFTTGQKARMDASLSAYRTVIWSPTNLTATGTDGVPVVLCTPKASIYKSLNIICPGESIQFQSNSYNSDTINYTWYFSGGTPATSPDTAPTITYSTPGTYNVSLVAYNSAGSDSIAWVGAVIVGDTAAFAPTQTYIQDFDTANFPSNGYVVNLDGGITWQRVSNAGHSGTSSIMVPNFQNTQGEVDWYITPSFDLRNWTSIMVKFWVSHAQRSTLHTEALNVYVSKSCANWNIRYQKNGGSLATTTITPSYFIPTSASQWRQESFNPIANGQPNVRFRFENISGAGNNTYIDEFQISGIYTGIEEAEVENKGFGIYPNPASQVASITYTLVKSSEVIIRIHDMVGKSVREISMQKEDPGMHLVHMNIGEFSKGVYFINLQTDHNSITRKFVIE